MGTSGVLGFIIRGKRRATYNHLDSYPRGLGAAIAEFIVSLTEEERLLMIERLDKVEWVSMDDVAPPDLVKRYRDEGFDYPLSSIDNESMRILFRLNRETADRFEQPTWHQLLIGIQGTRMLKPILDGRLSHIGEVADYGEDSSFCEWGYWVDFENQRFVMEQGCGEWTFADMKKEGVFWATHVQDKTSDRRLAEFREMWKVDSSAKYPKDDDKVLVPDMCNDARDSVAT